MSQVSEMRIANARYRETIANLREVLHGILTDLECARDFADADVAIVDLVRRWGTPKQVLDRFTRAIERVRDALK